MPSFLTTEGSFVSRQYQVAPTLRPPLSRAIGYSYTYRIYVFQGIAGYRAIPPFGGGGHRKMMLMFESTWGGIAGQGCPLRYRAL